MNKLTLAIRNLYEITKKGVEIEKPGVRIIRFHRDYLDRYSCGIILADTDEVTVLRQEECVGVNLVYYVMSGCAEIIVNGKSHTLCKDKDIRIYPSDSHLLKISEAPARILYMSIPISDRGKELFGHGG